MNINLAANFIANIYTTTLATTEHGKKKWRAGRDFGGTKSTMAINSLAIVGPLPAEIAHKMSNAQCDQY